MRCLVYSENVLFGRCLSDGLSRQSGVVFSIACTDLNALPDLAERHRISVAFADLAGRAGRDAVRAIKSCTPDLCILGLSIDETAAQDVVDCARMGCHGIVPRDATLSEVVDIARSAEHGEVRIQPKVAAHLMRALADGKTPAQPDQRLTERLTRREHEICVLVCEGLTNKEIANKVNRSVGTVKNHVSSILSKFDLPRRTAIYPHVFGAGTSPYRLGQSALMPKFASSQRR
jgi:DNA-binding NarL/FixJ family response regulator